MSTLIGMPMSGPELAARRDLCALASRLLATEIDAPLYQRLRVMSSQEANLTLIDPAIARLPERDAINELAVEFCRLFIGPRPVCPPYPAAHGRGAALAGLTERHFVDFLARNHLSETVLGSPALLTRDHLSIQLAVLAYLYDGTQQHITATSVHAVSAINELRNEHLRPWALDFASSLSAGARLSPYSTLCPVLIALLADEGARIG